MASSFSYAHMTEEEKQRILMGHNNPSGQQSNGLGGVSHMPMLGGSAAPA